MIYSFTLHGFREFMLNRWAEWGSMAFLCGAVSLASTPQAEEPIWWLFVLLASQAVFLMYAIPWYLIGVLVHSIDREERHYITRLLFKEW